MTALLLVSLLLAAGPAFLFLRNLRLFKPPRMQGTGAEKVAILIPARDEARNITAAVTAALANAGAEVLVLDDCSTDNTAGLVEAMAAHEPRVQLLRGAPLPNEWRGKNWACAQLAAGTDREVLIFVDADVRLAPDAAATLACWLRAHDAQLASGIPLQQLGSFSERLLIPLIHFVLLGFLPLARMRRFRDVAYGTGCGQLFVADAEAYRAAGGHGAIRSLLHDGLALPKAFRKQGFRTDLFDATRLATCRMYRGDAETWRGFAKNTHEGLGKPALIGPATVVLFAGQVLPFIGLAASHWLTRGQITIALLASAVALLPRIAAARRFHQPLATAWLHPLSICALLAIQWLGLARFFLRRPAVWKGRSYATSAGDGVPLANAGEQSPERIEHALDRSMN